MFSGIVEELASVLSLEKGEEKAYLTISSKLDHSDTHIGDSISNDGVCLTVVSKERIKASLGDGSDEAWRLSFDIASETLRCTTLGDLKGGDKVHIERSIAVGGRLHGHFVSGHVDAVGEVSARSTEGETVKLTVTLSEKTPLIAPKGSIAIAGVSLTVGEVQDEKFSVYIVPHTQEVTRLSKLEVRDRVNTEFDMVARYLVSYLNNQRGAV